jgi:hypothetical protein
MENVCNNDEGTIEQYFKYVAKGIATLRNVHMPCTIMYSTTQGSKSASAHDSNWFGQCLCSNTGM